MHIKTQNIRLREDEMDKACDIYGGENKCIHNFGGKIGRNESSLKALA
jgi:hypothetical protein